MITPELRALPHGHDLARELEHLIEPAFLSAGGGADGALVPARDTGHGYAGSYRTGDDPFDPDDATLEAMIIEASTRSDPYGLQPHTIVDAHSGHRSPTGFDVAAIRRDFPILAETVNGRPLVWLDNSATTQKPRAVIDRLVTFYEHENSNVHRGAHTLAARATDVYEKARRTVADFINAPGPENIVFVRGTTEGINLIAHSLGRMRLRAGDEIVISHLEHHANIVPWQLVCQETGAVLRVIPVDDTGQIDLRQAARLMGPRTKIVSITQVSNALGTVVPTAEIVHLAHRHGAAVVIDAAQSIAHLHTDVQTLDADFLVFSGHKIFGPTGIGAVYGKSGLLEAMSPYQGGGNMIADVTFERTLYNPPPTKFEAGTGNIADAAGLGAAIDYVSAVGLANISRYEHDLLHTALDMLQRVRGLRIIGSASERTSVLPFVMDGLSTETVNKALSEEGIAVRAGHHCAQPILRRFGLETTVRASLAFYNTVAEIEHLVDVLNTLSRNRSGGF